VRSHDLNRLLDEPGLAPAAPFPARVLIGGIETMHMIRKGQMNCAEGSTMSAAQQFYSLAV
jgi:putative transposase